MSNPIAKRNRSWWGSTALIVALALAPPARLDAASDCTRLPLRETRRHVELMFSGTVTNVQVLPVGRLFVNIDVDQVWKGRLRRATTIYPYGEPGGVPFIKGRRYLITGPKYLLLEFLDKRRDALELPPDSTFCGWGTPYENVARELATLDRPRVPR